MGSRRWLASSVSSTVEAAANLAMPFDRRDNKLDVKAVPGAQPRAPATPRASPRPYLSVLFNCCRVYQRVYRSRDDASYAGRCQRCGRPVRFRVPRQQGPPVHRGTDPRAAGGIRYPPRQNTPCGGPALDPLTCHTAPATRGRVLRTHARKPHGRCCSWKTDRVSGGASLRALLRYQRADHRGAALRCGPPGDGVWL